MKLKKTDKLIKKLNARVYYSNNKLAVKVNERKPYEYEVMLYMKVVMKRQQPEYHILASTLVVLDDGKTAKKIIRSEVDGAAYDDLLRCLAMNCAIPTLYDLGTPYENNTELPHIEVVDSKREITL